MTETDKFDAIDNLLAELDSIARDYDNYDYGLPMAIASDEYKALREKVAAYGAAQYEAGAASERKYIVESLDAEAQHSAYAAEIQSCVRTLPLREKD